MSPRFFRTRYGTENNSQPQVGARKYINYSYSRRATVRHGKIDPAEDLAAPADA